MDLQLLNRTIDFSKRRKKWLILFALFGASTYGTYRLYHSPSVTRKRKKLSRLIEALISILEIVSDSAEAISIVSRDLKEFISSDSDEIPNSLIQVSKIAKSDQFCKSVSRLSEALTIGVIRGYQSENKDGIESSITDQVMDRVLSNAGTGFVSVVAGSFARNLVLGFYASREQIQLSNPDSSMLDVVCSDKFKDMMGNSIQVFVSTAVSAYLDKTLDVNIYDELFAGLTNPKHEGKVRDILVSVCNGAVETFVKTSHQVLTNKNSGSSTNGDQDEFRNEEDAVNSTKRWVFDKMQTLSVPRNRRFVIDMTGRVTFETLRSIVDFLLWKLLDGLRRGSNVVCDQVVGKGREVVRYFSTKSSVIITICLALYLHVVGGTKPLLAV